MHQCLGLWAGVSQHLETRFDGVKRGLKRLQIGAARQLRAQALDAGFHAVGHLAQPQCTSQSGAAFDGVQVAQHLSARAGVVGPRDPLTQCTAKPGQQLLRFFGKDREQVNVDRVKRVDVVVNVLRRPTRQRVRQLGGQSRDRRQIQTTRLGQREIGQDKLVSQKRFGLIHRLRRGHRVVRCVARRCRQRFRHPSWQRLVHDAVQGRQQRLVGVLQKASSELVQQAANVFCGIHKQLSGLGASHPARLLVQTHRGNGVLKRTGDLGQGTESDRGRTASQRVGQRLGRGRGDLIPLQRPFRQLGTQPSRPFVGFVQVHVVELDADAQRTDYLGLVVGKSVGHQR